MLCLNPTEIKGKREIDLKTFESFEKRNSDKYF